MWPPSRPTNTLGRPTERSADAEDVATAHAREEPRERTGKVVSRRLMEVLDEDSLEALLAFLESGDDDAVLLAREDGRVAAVNRGTSRPHASR